MLDRFQISAEDDIPADIRFGFQAYPLGQSPHILYLALNPHFGKILIGGNIKEKHPGRQSPFQIAEIARPFLSHDSSQIEAIQDKTFIDQS